MIAPKTITDSKRTLLPCTRAFISGSTKPYLTLEMHVDLAADKILLTITYYPNPYPDTTSGTSELITFGIQNTCPFAVARVCKVLITLGDHTFDEEAIRTLVSVLYRPVINFREITEDAYHEVSVQTFAQRVTALTKNLPHDFDRNVLIEAYNEDADLDVTLHINALLCEFQSSANLTIRYLRGYMTIQAARKTLPYGFNCNFQGLIDELEERAEFAREIISQYWQGFYEIVAAINPQLIALPRNSVPSLRTPFISKFLDVLERADDDTYEAVIVAALAITYLEPLIERADNVLPKAHKDMINGSVIQIVRRQAVLNHILNKRHPKSLKEYEQAIAKLINIRQDGLHSVDITNRLHFLSVLLETKEASMERITLWEAMDVMEYNQKHSALKINVAFSRAQMGTLFVTVTDLETGKTVINLERGENFWTSPFTIVHAWTLCIEIGCMPLQASFDWMLTGMQYHISANQVLRNSVGKRPDCIYYKWVKEEHIPYTDHGLASFKKLQTIETEKTLVQAILSNFNQGSWLDRQMLGHLTREVLFGRLAYTPNLQAAGVLNSDGLRTLMHSALGTLEKFWELLVALSSKIEMGIDYAPTQPSADSIQTHNILRIWETLDPKIGFDLGLAVLFFQSVSTYLQIRDKQPNQQHIDLIINTLLSFGNNEQPRPEKAEYEAAMRYYVEGVNANPVIQVLRHPPIF